MSVSIRPALPEHWPVLFALWVEAWSASLPEIDFTARLPWFRDHVANLQREGARVLVAIDDADPIGFVTVNAAKQDMDQLVTCVAAQRHGVGRLLVRAAKACAPHGLGLKVVQINRPAIALYQSEGFVVTGQGISERSGLANVRMRWPGRPADGSDQWRSNAR